MLDYDSVLSNDSRKTGFVSQYNWRTSKRVLVKSRLTRAIERAKASGRSYVVGYKKCYIDDGTYNTYEDMGTWKNNLWTRKKCIVKLHIPVKAPRRQPINYKCRAAQATVVGVYQYAYVYDKNGKERIKLTKIDAIGQPNNKPKSPVRYMVGKVVRPELQFSLDNTECASGIHFFLRVKEAVEW